MEHKMQNIIKTIDLAKEALRAIERGVPSAGLITETELRERAKCRLAEALVALDAEHVRPMGAA